MNERTTEYVPTPGSTKSAGEDVSRPHGEVFNEGGLLPSSTNSGTIAIPIGDAPASEKGLRSFGRLRSASMTAVDIFKHRPIKMSANPREHWRAFLGEFLGTTVFIYLNLVLGTSGLQAIANNQKPDSSGAGLLQAGLVGGGALTALIFSLGHIWRAR